MKTPCYETDQRTVGRPFDGWRLNRNLQKALCETDNCFSASSGLNSDVQRGDRYLTSRLLAAILRRKTCVAHLGRGA